MRAKPLVRASSLLLAAALAVPAVGAQAAPRSAKARAAAGVTIDYSVNLAGIPIGNAQLTEPSTARATAWMSRPCSPAWSAR